MKLSRDAILLLCEITKSRLHLLGDTWAESIYTMQLSDIQETAMTNVDQAQSDMDEVLQSCSVDIAKKGRTPEEAMVVPPGSTEALLIYADEKGIDIQRTMPEVIQWTMAQLMRPEVSAEIFPFPMKHEGAV